MASALLNAMLASEEESKKAAPKSARERAAEAEATKPAPKEKAKPRGKFTESNKENPVTSNPGASFKEPIKLTDKELEAARAKFTRKPLTGESSSLLSGQQSQLLGGENTPFMSNLLTGQKSGLNLGGQSSPLFDPRRDQTELMTSLLGGQKSRIGPNQQYGPPSAQPRLQGQKSNYPLTYSMVEDIVGPLSPGQRTNIGETGMARGQAGSQAEGVEFKQPATLTPEEEEEARRVQSQADLFTKDFTEWEKDRIRRESSPNARLTGGMQRPGIATEPKAADYMSAGTVGTPAQPGATAPAPIPMGGAFGRFASKSSAPVEQQLETRTGTDVPKPPTGQPQRFGQNVVLNSDELLGSLQGKEIATVSAAKKFEDNIVAGVSPIRAANAILQSTDYDEANPFHKALRYYTEIASSGNDKQKEVAKQGIVALTDYFTRSNKPDTTHGESTFRSAIEYLNLSTNPNMSEATARAAFGELATALGEDSSRLSHLFGSDKQRTEARNYARTDMLADVVNKSIRAISTDVLKRMPSSNAPAAAAARDLATRYLSPLTIDGGTSGVSPIEWMDQNPIASKLGNDLLFEAQRLHGSSSLGNVQQIVQKINSGVGARRFGGQFDLRSTIEQLTKPNYIGREEAFVKDKTAADEAEAKGDKKAASRLMAPYYTSAALDLMYGDDATEGYESGRAVGVTTGLSGTLKVSADRQARAETIAAITRNKEPRRTTLTPTGLVGSLFAEAGLPQSLLKFTMPSYGGTVTFKGTEGATYVRSFAIPGHPELKLTLDVPRGSRSIDPTTGRVVDAYKLSADDNARIEKIISDLSHQSDPEAALLRARREARAKNNLFLDGKYKFGIIRKDQDIVGHNEEFIALRNGYSAGNNSKDQATFFGDTQSDIQSLIKLPVDENGIPYIDQESQRMYELLVDTQKDISSNIGKYTKNGNVYTFTGKENPRGLPLTLSQNDYEALRNSQITIRNILQSADQIREEAGASGGTTGFRTENGRPILSQPLPVTGDNRFRQVSTLLDSWVNKVPGAPDFTKLFDGINMESKTVKMYDVDQDGKPIKLPGHLREVPVNDDGTVNVNQYRVVKQGSSETYVPVMGEDGKQRTVNASVNDVGVTLGISTEKSKAMSSGRFGLTGDYLYSTFMQTHREINKGLQIDSAAESFARTVLGSTDEKLIASLKDNGITPEQLRKVLTSINRQGGQYLSTWLSTVDAKKFVPVGRAAGTMNATSDPRRTSDQILDSIIKKEGREAQVDVGDIIVRRNASIWDTVTRTANNLYEAEGQTKTDQVGQIERIVKSALNNNNIDAELKPALESAARNYVTSLVYNDEISREPAFEFMRELHDYASTVAKNTISEGTYESKSLPGTSTFITEGRGQLADKRLGARRSVAPALRSAIDLINFNENSLAVQSIKAGGKRSAELSLVDVIRSKYNAETDGAKKTELFNQLYKAVHKALAAGYTMPSDESQEFRASVEKRGATMEASSLTLSADQKLKADVRAKVAEAVARKNKTEGAQTPSDGEPPKPRTIRVSAVDVNGTPIDVFKDVTPDENGKVYRPVYKKLRGEWVPVVKNGKPQTVLFTPAAKPVKDTPVVDPTVNKKGINWSRVDLGGLTLKHQRNASDDTIHTVNVISAVAHELNKVIPQDVEDRPKVLWNALRRLKTSDKTFEGILKDAGIVVGTTDASVMKTKVGSPIDEKALRTALGDDYGKYVGYADKIGALLGYKRASTPPPSGARVPVTSKPRIVSTGTKPRKGSPGTGIAGTTAILGLILDSMKKENTGKK